MTLPTILFTYHTDPPLISVSYDKSHEIRAYNPWYGPLISVTSDITAMWYHGFHDMFALYHCTCAAGWRGLGAPASRCSTSSGLAIANVLGGQWGLVFSWTGTALIQRMDLMQSLWPSFKFKVEIYKLDITSSSNLWTAANHCHLCSHLAQVGHLAVAGLPHCAQDWQSHRSAPESAGQTRIHCQLKYNSIGCHCK
jgi:hypothetical protein